MWPFKRKPKPLPIPEPPKQWHIRVGTQEQDSGLEVHELDASDVDIKELQSRTGIMRAFDRITGKFKDPL